MSIKAILAEQQKGYTKVEEDALLANKQDTLNLENVGTAGQILTKTSTGTAWEIAQGHENLLCNWYFVGGGSQQGAEQFPINERGSIVYTSTGTLRTINNWQQFRGTATLVASGLQLVWDGTTGTGVVCRQMIKGQPFTDKQFTCSLLYTTGSEVKLITSTFTGTSSFNYTTTPVDNFIIRIQTYQGNTLFDIERQSTTAMTILAAKVEMGSNQSLAHQENSVWVLNELPNYQEELFKCKTAIVDPTDNFANNNNIVDKHYSRPNLLDNWYFVGGGSQLGNGIFPINQRGLTTYEGNNIYTIDRWACYLSLDIYSDGIDFARIPATQYAPSMGQYIKKNKLIVGETYCISVLWSDGTLWSNSGILSGSTSDWQIISGLANDNGCAIRSRNSTQWQITAWNTDSTRRIVAFKLEQGTGQTLAHQENGTWVLNEYPDFATELLKCRTATDDTADIYANNGDVADRYYSRPNLLYNWYFLRSNTTAIPINSRGLTTYTTGSTGIYTIDKWWLTTQDSAANSLVVTSDGIQLNGVSNARLVQEITSSAVNYLANQMVTISVLVSSVSGSASQKGSVALSIGGGMNSFYSTVLSVPITGTGLFSGTVRIPENANKLNFFIKAENDCSVKIHAVKLEIGVNQTLCEYDTAISKWLVREVPFIELEEFKSAIARASDTNDPYSNQMSGTGMIKVSFNIASGATSTTYTNDNIRSDHYVISHKIGTPSAINSDLIITTSDGSLTVTNSVATSSATTLELILARPKVVS